MGRNARLGFCVTTFAIACLVLAPSWVHALPPLSVTYQDSFGLQSPVQPNWGNNTGIYPSVVLHLQQFNPNIGMLDSIHIDLHSSASGTVKVESRDSVADTINASITDTVSIQRPDGSNFVSPLPIAHLTTSLSKYDGATDFIGTSGLTYSNSASNNDILDLTPASPGFSSFIGTGTIPLTASALGATSLTGATNLSSLLRSYAEADVTVTYNYSMHLDSLPIPEPTGLGLIAFAAFFASRPKRAR